MTLTRRDVMRLSAGALTLSVTTRATAAETFPARPVRVLVGFPVGGPVDIAARVIAPWLSQQLGQTFAVENQPGESGNRATRTALKSAPDGYTLLLCGPVNTINTTLFPDLDFDFARDSEPVGGLFRVPLVIEVNPSLPIHSAAEFIAYAKANPGQLKIAYAGNGTPQHVGIELFKSMAGVDVTLVPYLGSAPALVDLLNGRVHAMFDPLPSSIGHIRSGQLRPLAVTTPLRSPALPDVPVMSDLVPEYEAGSWFGLVAPKGTPADVIATLNGQMNTGLNDAALKARVAELGGAVMGGSSESFGRFVRSETEHFARVIHAAGIKAG